MVAPREPHGHLAKVLGAETPALGHRFEKLWLSAMCGKPRISRVVGPGTQVLGHLDHSLGDPWVSL